MRIGSRHSRVGCGNPAPAAGAPSRSGRGASVRHAAAPERGRSEGVGQRGGATRGRARVGRGRQAEGRTISRRARCGGCVASPGASPANRPFDACSGRSMPRRWTTGSGRGWSNRPRGQARGWPLMVSLIRSEPLRGFPFTPTQRASHPQARPRPWAGSGSEPPTLPGPWRAPRRCRAGLVLERGDPVLRRHVYVCGTTLICLDHPAPTR